MINGTNTTMEEPPIPNEAERIFKIIFYIVLFIVGTTGNFLVVVVVKAKRRHRTVNDYFILNLAISDITFLCFALPFYYYELFEKFQKFSFYCSFVWPMMSVTLLVSIFTLTLMAVERCRAILFPFRPRIKKPTVSIAIITVWALSLLFMLPLMIVAKPMGIYCQESWSKEDYRKAYTAVLFILQFAMPITIIAVAYIAIVITLYTTKVPNRTSVNQRGQVIKQKTNDNIHIIRTVAIIVVLFVICMLPNQIAWILIDFGGTKYQDLSEKFWLLAEALMFFHSCVNPIIYGSITRQYRDGYIQYLRYLCCCGRHYTPNQHDLTVHDPSKLRIAKKLTYQGSLISPGSVNSIRSSCQGPTVISSCRLVTSRSPPSPARSLPDSLRSNPVAIRPHLNSPSGLRRIPPNPARIKLNGARPPSPLVIDNKMLANETKLSSINDIDVFVDRSLTIHNGKRLNDEEKAKDKHTDESIILRNSAHELENKKTDNNKQLVTAVVYNGFSKTEIISQNTASQSTVPSMATIDQSTVATPMNQSEVPQENVISQSSVTSIQDGSSDNYGIDDDETSVYDTHL